MEKQQVKLNEKLKKQQDNINEMTAKHKIKINEQTKKQQNKINDKLKNQQVKETRLTRCTKIRIYPTVAQKKILKEWLGTTRYVYNKALNGIKNNVDKINKFELRDKYVTKKNNINVKDWEIRTPKHTREHAIRSLCSNYKSAFSNLKNGNILKFNLNYKSKKNKNDSISIPSNTIKINNKKLYVYNKFEHSYSLVDGIKMSNDKILKRIPTIENDSLISYSNNKWFFILSYNIDIDKTTVPKENMCSMDPGSITFQTMYTGDSVVKIQHNRKTLLLLKAKINQFKSLRNSKNKINKSHCNRRIRKLYFKINNLIDDMQCKTVSYLTKTYKYILLPSFESQDMVKKSNNKRMNENLLELRHFRFQTRLLNKSETIMNSLVEICTEECTTRTCGNCGFFNEKNRLVYKKNTYSLMCLNCNTKIDRDTNGSRNILIKKLQTIPGLLL